MGDSNFSEIRGSASYRQFLARYLETHEASQAAFARKVGCARGFPGEVIAGRRRLSHRSARAFENALRLPLEGRRFFRLLLAQAEPDLFPRLEPAKVRAQIEDLRRRTWGKSRKALTIPSDQNVQDLLSDPDILAVFAATGGLESGANTAEVMSRTGLTPERIKILLSKLETAQLIRRDKDHYFSNDLHVALQIEDRNQTFATLFQSACLAAAQRGHQAMDSPEEFFFASAFCVQEARLPALKAQLREIMMRFLEKEMMPEGNRVVRLVTGLHR